MQFNTILYNSVKRKTRISLCSWDQLVEQTKIIWEMPVLKYQWQRNGLAYVCSAQLISQAGAIWGAGPRTDAAGHGTCWYAGADSPGTSVPNHCGSPASVVGPCTSPRLCALPLLTLTAVVKDDAFLLLLRAGECYIHMYTHICVHTHTHTDTVLVPSLPGQPLKNDTVEEEEKKKENDNEGGELQVLCRGEKER